MIVPAERRDVCDLGVQVGPRWSVGPTSTIFESEHAADNTLYTVSAGPTRPSFNMFRGAT